MRRRFLTMCGVIGSPGRFTKGLLGESFGLPNCGKSFTLYVLDGVEEGDAFLDERMNWRSSWDGALKS